MGRKKNKGKSNKRDEREEKIIQLLISKTPFSQIIKSIPGSDAAMIRRVERRNIHRIEKARANENKRKQYESKDKKRTECVKKEENNKKASDYKRQQSTPHASYQRSDASNQRAKQIHTRKDAFQRDYKKTPYQPKKYSKNGKDRHTKKQYGMIPNTTLDFVRKDSPFLIFDNGKKNCIPVSLAKEATILEVGLCSKRHSMEESFYIFTPSDGDRHMFDYPWQENHARKFIQEHIPFENGVATKKLVVKTTGLNCFNAAITKACFELKVNLTLKHFNNGSKEYRKQVVFDDFPVAKSKMSAVYPELLDYVKGEMYALKHEPSALRDARSVYIVSLKYRSKEGTEYQESIVGPDFLKHEIWAIFEECAEVIGKYGTSKWYALYIDKCYLKRNGDGEQFIRERKNIAKAYSYHEYDEKKR